MRVTELYGMKSKLARNHRIASRNKSFFSLFLPFTLCWSLANCVLISFSYAIHTTLNGTSLSLLLFNHFSLLVSTQNVWRRRRWWDLWFMNAKSNFEHQLFACDVASVFRFIYSSMIVYNVSMDIETMAFWPFASTQTCVFAVDGTCGQE